MRGINMWENNHKFWDVVKCYNSRDWLDKTRLTTSERSLYLLRTRIGGSVVSVIHSLLRQEETKTKQKTLSVRSGVDLHKK